ncbi:hypothetical protein BEN51_01580 [Clostridium isatidis]|uniref:Uncharacterized protein n=1 Tax=Clostridium isatidis TaxID=182773 RepID=A0A343J9L8_9CLOT|nr:hypothetical protein BEN51_01580 [Clostridium isatidis]
MRCGNINKIDILSLFIFIIIASFTLYVRNPALVKYYWILYIVEFFIGVYIAIRLFYIKDFSIKNRNKI